MSTSAPQHTRVLQSGAQVRVSKTPLTVRVERGPDRRRSADLVHERITIGSHETCDFPLTDPTISRQHCEIVVTSIPNAPWLIRDLGSRNGTYVEDLRVIEAGFSGRIRVRLGETVLEVAPAPRMVDIEVAQTTAWGELLGRSPQMRQVFAALDKAAATDATVLLGGESGTGKELAARSLHQMGRRANAPFVVVDCAALPETLIESELYGHERGAFTGADRQRVGAFVAAEGGTIFLDEIGELSLAMQARLLGVLERRVVQPLGSHKTRPIDVRLIAATNRDLRREVNTGNFRADLFFRLSVVNIHLPALRDRPEDIDLYVEAFLDEWAQAETHITLPGNLAEQLRGRTWRGNVRELRNVLSSALVLGEIPDDSEIERGARRYEMTHVPPASDAGSSESGQLNATAPQLAHATALQSAQDVATGEHVDDELVSSLARTIDPRIPYKILRNDVLTRFEQVYLRALIESHHGNVTRAAKTAEIDRVYLLRLLDRYEMRPSKAR